MTTTEPRPSRAQQLRDLIDVLVSIVAEHGGSMRCEDAILELGERTGLPLTEGHYVINNAVADGRAQSSLRHGTVTLTDPAG